ncbi:hypothetical protein [Archangium sp.]|uniref:hypothetical protein n=1 Tax=Archangium sp. TaxID=1872627 RepID=UPI002D24CE2D|nr:hypothetical protein [Archangium sp.]HYO57148.1 hypothetical protein [Archangium sp.]
MSLDIPSLAEIKDGLTIIALLLGGGLAVVRLRLFRLIVPNARLSLRVQHVEHSTSYRLFVQLDIENLTSRKISMRDYKLSVVSATEQQRFKDLPGCFGSISENLHPYCEEAKYCHQVPPPDIHPKELSDPQQLLTIDKGEHITLAYAHDIPFDPQGTKPTACRITAVFTSRQREWSWRHPLSRGQEYAWFKDGFYVFDPPKASGAGKGSAASAAAAAS